MTIETLKKNPKAWVFYDYTICKKRDTRIVIGKEKNGNWFDFRNGTCIAVYHHAKQIY